MSLLNVHAGNLVAFVYRHTLHRDAEPDEVSAWSAELENGLSFDAFVELVSASDEASSVMENELDEALAIIGNMFCHALSRHPTSAEVADWSARLRQGDSIASLVDKILDRPETRWRAEKHDPRLVERAIAFVYQHALGRQPSDADLGLWSKHLEDGLPFPRILDEVTNSAEGRRWAAIMAEPPSVDAISFVYRHALGRDASNDDLRIWSEHLSGGFSFQRFLLDMLASDESRRRSRPLDPSRMATTISFVYVHTVGRTPNDPEVRHWAGLLKGGLFFERFLLDMMDSEEAKGHSSVSASARALSNGSFVAHLYEICLGRCALPSELELWKRRLIENGYRRSDMALWFVEAAILEEQRQAEGGQGPDTGNVWIMGTNRILNAQIWGERAREVEEGRNLVQASPLSAPYVVRPNAIRVSAIASLYKGGPYICKFLDNMVQQSLGGNFELIIIDADSPDGEHEVIREYQKTWPNIRYERMNYRIGIYDAWNVAVGLARGDYLTNTNLDDLRRRDSLELQAEMLDAVPFADVVYQDFFYSLNSELSFEQVEAYNFKSFLPLVSPNNLLAYNSPHNAPMWRKRLHSELGLFDTLLKSAGDHEFWLRCLQAGKVFYKINTPHVVYYQNPDGISTRPGTFGIIEGQRIQRKYGRKLISPDLYLDQASLTTKLDGVSGGLSTASEGEPTYERIQRLILSLAETSNPHRGSETVS